MENTKQTSSSHRHRRPTVFIVADAVKRRVVLLKTSASSTSCRFHSTVRRRREGGWLTLTIQQLFRSSPSRRTIQPQDGPPYSPSHSSFVVYPRKGTLRKPKPPPGVPFDPYSLVAEDTDSGDPLHTQNKTLYLQDMLAGEARRARGEPAFPSIHGEGSVKMREAEPASEPVVCEPPERPLLQDPFDDTNKVVDVAVEDEEEDEATATSKRENYSRPRRLATCPPCIEVS
ncbi:hypothetical protein SCP_1403870 [Sparassis crispa]|uniref:Uncharacterized protein n=1 Tax=Sparassis crispa TaxID=139825 RepID=A0A401H3L8_9APHY|nr:hypothetical protein SCP_1403870 [Sparassis crispa]GBE88979.1 hypothetical protein SCP_1403870 [Sparassis crispa]